MSVAWEVGTGLFVGAKIQPFSLEGNPFRRLTETSIPTLSMFAQLPESIPCVPHLESSQNSVSMRLAPVDAHCAESSLAGVVHSSLGGVVDHGQVPRSEEVLGNKEDVLSPHGGHGSWSSRCILIGSPYGKSALPGCVNIGSSDENARLFQGSPSSLLGGAASSASSSSIGGSVNSPNSCEENEIDDMEVQSGLYGPLYQMDSLEAALPVKRGLSKYFMGKSRSFICLADVCSIKDLAKPESPFLRKRRNSHSSLIERHKAFQPLHRVPGGGISKRPTSGARSSLALAVAMGSQLGGEDVEDSKSSDHPGSLRGFKNKIVVPSRSLSLTDLRSADCLSPPLGKDRLMHS